LIFFDFLLDFLFHSGYIINIGAGASPEFRGRDTKMTNHPNRSRKAYLKFNHYGSETSVGFDNSWSAMVFESRADRDIYLERWKHKDRSLRPCTRAQALRYAEKYEDRLLLRFYEDDSKDFWLTAKPSHQTLWFI
jgi:hypothetical protein